MKINEKNISLKRTVCLCLYYGFARYLPKTGSLFNVGGRLRAVLCRQIFSKCGAHVNIERGAWFGTGHAIEIGDYSAIGIDAHIPSDTKIGNFVMMGPNCYILDVNHKFSDVHTPMCRQGMDERKMTVIGDDVWIGRDVKMTPGRHIANGTVIGMGTVLSKDFPAYSIVAGSPVVLIRMRE